MNESSSTPPSRSRGSEQSFKLPESTSVAMGDLDHDGDLDILTTGNYGSLVWFNDGRGRFQADKERIGDGPCEAVALVDLDNDHDLDIVGGGWVGSRPRVVWLNNGKGQFAKGPALGASNTQSLASGDLDDDGDQDLVFGNLSFDGGPRLRPAEVWLNRTDNGPLPASNPEIR